ncbi:MAG: hypothetical protein H7062_10350 [Candidatus Saccharimonas sp.]|nr:hypothetical protein [Planctomycetaceae bacterium]
MAPREAIGRREFMTQAAVTAAATTVFAAEGVGSAAAADSPPAVVKLDVKTATSATFKALIGQTFQVSKQKFVLEKVEVTPDRNCAKRPRGVRQESFLLLFSAPSGVHLAPGIYTFSSSTRGPFGVYMNEVQMTSTFPTSSALGQAERFLGIVATNVKSTPAKVYYQAPFS